MESPNYAFLARTATRAAALMAEWEPFLSSYPLTDHEANLWRDWIENQRWAIAEVERRMPDEALLTAYQRTFGRIGDPEADALLAEIERRGLEI